MCGCLVDIFLVISGVFFMLDYQAKSASGDPEAGFMVFSLILVVVAGLFGAWWNKHKNG